MRGSSTACMVLVAVMLTGCGSPAARFDSEAARVGIARVDTELATFREGEFTDGRDIHIYLDGDGTPAVRGGRPSLDPTSRDRVILELMAADPNPRVLVGRPCYHGLQADCDPALWTVRRYSDDVVDALSRVINPLITPYPRSRVVVFGYSGGGTLAMLVAPRLARIDAVVTIAANLDTGAWTRHHGYGPLTGSRNPADEPPLDRRIRQLHLFGAEDENVPAELARATLERQPAATVEVIEGFDHRCCWPDIWAAKLGEIARRLDGAGAQ